MRLDGQEQLALRLRQAAERADKLARPIAARFLSGAERSLAIHAAREAGVEVAFDGGWPEAERVQPCFYPQDEEPIFTGVWMQAKWNAKFAAVDHRALLGSLMALGMDRAFFGDIIALEDRAYLYVLPEKQKKGYGKGLLLALEKELVQANIHVMQLISIDDNLGFYHASGMGKDSVNVMYKRF